MFGTGHCGGNEEVYEVDNSVDEEAKGELLHPRRAAAQSCPPDVFLLEVPCMPLRNDDGWEPNDENPNM